MTPSLFHVPLPKGTATSQRFCEGPPDTSARLRNPSSKNATDRLSGDQNGCVMTFPLRINCRDAELKSTLSSPGLGAPGLLTTHRPSGEIESGGPVGIPAPRFGSTKRTALASGEPCR